MLKLKSGENMYNTFKENVLTTFGMHRQTHAHSDAQTDSRTARKHASGHYVGVKKMKLNDDDDGDNNKHNLYAQSKNAVHAAVVVKLLIHQ